MQLHGKGAIKHQSDHCRQCVTHDASGRIADTRGPVAAPVGDKSGDRPGEETAEALGLVGVMTLPIAMLGYYYSIHRISRRYSE